MQQMIDYVLLVRKAVFFIGKWRLQWAHLPQQPLLPLLPQLPQLPRHY